MKWSYRIATISGIEVRIHVTFLLLIAYFGWVYYQDGGWPAAAQGILFIGLLFLCVVLHEFGHALMARRFGIRTPDITLLPIGGLARLERMPSNPWQELCIAIAGPAVNVVIAIILGLVLLGQGAFRGEELEQVADFQGGLLFNLFVVNIVLIIFNAIPAFPMDGGRVLRALLAMKFGLVKATTAAARVGQGIAVLFFLASFTPYGSIMLALIGLFVFSGAQQELYYVKQMEAFSGATVARVMSTRFDTLPYRVTIAGLSPYLLRSSQAVFPFVDEDMQYHGLANREDLARALQEMPPDAYANAVGRRIPGIGPSAPLMEAVQMMQRLEEPILPVLNPGGQIVGLLSATT